MIVRTVVVVVSLALVATAASLGGGADHHAPKPHRARLKPVVIAPPPLCEKGYRLYHEACYPVVRGQG